MRYKMSAQNLYDSIRSSAPNEVPRVSRDPHWAQEADMAYYVYPRFLLHRLNQQICDRLYFPWEKPSGFEPLCVYLATTHHWELTAARKLTEDQLIDILRPELKALRLDAEDVLGFEAASGGCAEEILLQNLRSRGPDQKSSDR